MKSNPAPAFKLPLAAFKGTIAATCLLFISAQCKSQTAPTRADSFFGVHFDFHATDNDKNIGATITQQNVDAFLDYVKPDFIQVDTKGHPGYASYPTKIGVHAGIVKDPLAVIRASTSSRGIGLYAHYSAILDGEAVKNHPAWGRLKATGAQDVEGSAAVSIFSPYVDTYFIPQLKELANNYKLDGIWVDGDCWAMAPDYSSEAIAAAKAKGIKRLPKPGDANYYQYLQFTRNAFQSYLEHYVNALHADDPKLQICSNWAYAYIMGPVEAKVDFLSGDLNSDDPAEVEFDTRLLAAHNIPWDLMGWGRNTALPLEKKAAITLAQGGAYEVYMQQNRDASLPTAGVAPVKATADFCRAYKQYSWKTQPIPQVAILLSSYGHNMESPSVFSISDGGMDITKATLRLYLSMKYSTQVLQEYQLSGKLSQYPLVVIPGWKYIEPSFVSELKQYVNNGGKLIIAGTDANAMFKDVETSEINDPSIPKNLPVKAFKYGKGIIVGTFSNMSLQEMAAKQAMIRSLFSGITSKLMPNPIIKVSGSDDIHVNATTKNGEKLFHLVNINPSANATPDLSVGLRLASRPSAIVLQPEGRSLPFTYSDSIAKLTVPGVSIYSILEVKN